MGSSRLPGGFTERMQYCQPLRNRFNSIMPTLEQVEKDAKQLTREDRAVLREMLENLAEDELEFTDEFKAKLERAKAQVAAGQVRVVRP